MQDQDKNQEQLFEELEALRQRTLRFQKIAEERDTFTYGIAQDLKRPLSLIIGFTESLLKDYATIPPEELLEQLQVIGRSARAMDGIINEMLLLVHVRDLEGVDVTPLDMQEIVGEVLNRLSYVIKTQQAHVAAQSQWPAAVGYAPWIEEIWFAYLSEALRNGERPQSIELGGVEQADGRARFWVRVYRLSPEQVTRLSRLFESFSPGLVQRAMEKLNGQYGVEQGQVDEIEFYFTLPAM